MLIAARRVPYTLTGFEPTPTRLCRACLLALVTRDRSRFARALQIAWRAPVTDSPAVVSAGSLALLLGPPYTTVERKTFGIHPQWFFFKDIIITFRSKQNLIGLLVDGFVTGNIVSKAVDTIGNYSNKLSS